MHKCTFICTPRTSYLFPLISLFVSQMSRMNNAAVFYLLCFKVQVGIGVMWSVLDTLGKPLMLWFNKRLSNTKFIVLIPV